MSLVKCWLQAVPSWVVVVLGVVAAFLALYEGHLYIRVIACVVTVFALIVQFLQSQTYVYEIKSNNWNVRSNGEFELNIPRVFHAKGKAPQVVVYKRELNDRYSEIVCDIETSGSGDVIIVATQNFNGQVRIK